MTPNPINLQSNHRVPNAYSILEVIPHDLPMSLLDSIEQRSEAGITTVVTITRNSVFLEEQGVPAWVGIEYIGQTIAAFAGAQAKDRGERVKIGFLVSTRRYETNCSYFPLGACLRISATQLSEDSEGLQTFACTIRGTDTGAARIEVQARLNVFLPKDIDLFLKERQL